MFVCVCARARVCSCCVSFCVIVFCVLTTMSSAINYVCLPLTLFLGNRTITVNTIPTITVILTPALNLTLILKFMIRVVRADNYPLH